MKGLGQYMVIAKKRGLRHGCSLDTEKREKEEKEREREKNDDRGSGTSRVFLKSLGILSRGWKKKKKKSRRTVASTTKG